jgi:hypothetical protein
VFPFSAVIINNGMATNVVEAKIYRKGMLVRRIYVQQIN